ncbi:FAD:protein FMN transferase [Microbacterium sp. UCD-TDU]|uniref:FAD:protein FMN transferase n=1 Tax=Microbacterium sp. UCD-TDU TaxID=1247714 RepID=UPI000348E289|nr:FAD:protein FMN transferase [Microbacterium sp. UCD-TDU]EYT59605.1 lipoprotein [Microbacterium sp. UCD-TDU]
MRAAHRQTRVWVEEIMGTPMSVHLISAGARDEATTERAVRACFDELHQVDRVFSTYRPDSDINRIRRGEMALADADPRVGVAAAACERAEQATGGLFSGHWQGWFDPTGWVKGWAVEEASRRHLAPLLSSALAVGINAGGDLQLFTAPGADWRWHVGIADPHERGRMIATLDIADGAVATSGTAERGLHILDPRTSEPATGVASATIVADGLAQADVWATAAVVAGRTDHSWIGPSATRTGIVVDDDGAVTRWLGSTVIDVCEVSGSQAA